MGKYIYRKKTVNDPVEFLSAFKNGYPYAYLEYSKEMEQPLYRYLLICTKRIKTLSTASFV